MKTFYGLILLKLEQNGGTNREEKRPTEQNNIDN